MSRKFKVPLNLVGLTTDPGSATNGDLYFNTVSNKVRYYTQNTWQDLGAAAGGATVQVSTAIPATATEGKLWYDNDDARLYVYDGTYWVEVSIGPVGPAGPAGAGVATAGTTGQYLVKSSNNNYETTWSTLPAASLTSTDISYVTGATSNLQTQINTLSTNLGNTLDDYVPIGDVGQPDGVASLDSSGKIPIAQLGNLIDGAPAALDTLNELAAAINDDASYAAGITTALGLKAPIASPTFTGNVVLPSTTTYNGTNIQTSLDSKSNKAKSVSTKTADYTLTTSDVDSIIEFNSSSDLNLTLPTYSSAPFVYGSGFSIANRGTGKINILNQSGTDPLSSYTTTGLPGSPAYSTFYANNVYLAQVGSQYYRSVDGVTWTGISGISASSSSSTQRIAYGNGLFLLTSFTGIWTSSDAVTWTQRLTSSQTYSIKYANSKFFAGGSNGVMFTSSDGLSWTNLGQITTVNSTTIRSIEYLGSNTWYAATTSSGNSLKSTDNGATWSSLSAPSGSLSIAYDGTTLLGATVGSSTNNYYVSSNGGSSWTTKSYGLTVFSSAPYYDGSKIYLAYSNISSPQTLRLVFLDPTAALSVQSTISTSSFGTYSISARASGGYLLLTSSGTSYTAGSVTTSYKSENNESFIPAGGRADIYNYNQNQFFVSGDLGDLSTKYAPIASPTFTGTVILPNSTVTNAMLSNSSITINGSAVSLGGSATIAAGLTPVAVSTNITMVANTRYFVDTANDLTLTLPATPALGAEIELYDASNNAFASDVVILRNGQKINGLTEDAALDINGFAVSFIYTGSTYGWRMK